MKVSDYIVDFLVKKGVRHFWGYQGTMIAHFVDSVAKHNLAVNHSVYNEQAAAFSACGYAKASGKCGVAYSTSGPGAMNLISGIADAYYDSAPVIFITGQINTNEYTDVPNLRQQAFQESNIVDMTKSVTKYAVFIDDPEQVCIELEKAWTIANTGRKGPVLLDIPMNIQRSEIQIEMEVNKRDEYNTLIKERNETIAEEIIGYINQAKRPIILLGNGIDKSDEIRGLIRLLISKWQIPVISTLLGSDILDFDNIYNFGTVGAAYGHRYANLIINEKADLIVSLGASLCRRQTGINNEQFAKNAKIVRIDIDATELKRKVHVDEIQFEADINPLINLLLKKSFEGKYVEWVKTCTAIKEELIEFDYNCVDRYPNKFIEIISGNLDNAIITCDVGQHMMWVMQSFRGKNCRILYSGGHGAMGFALPAAIGAYYSTEGEKEIICIAGDGAFQMNIQELQTLVKERIPIRIIVLNNNSLGLIRQQQDDFFGSKYYGSMPEGGFSSPDFSRIATAYGLLGHYITEIEELKKIMERKIEEPELIEIKLPENTKAIPKTYFGQKMSNQKPYIPVEMYEKLVQL